MGASQDSAIGSARKVEVLSKGAWGQPAWVRINLQEYVALEHDPCTILVLEETARELLVKDLPRGIALTPCKWVHALESEEREGDLEIPIVPSQFEGVASFKISNVGSGRASIIFNWSCTKEFWSNGCGYRWKLQRAKAAVSARARKKNLVGVRFHRFFDRGAYAGVEFAKLVTSSSVESVIQDAYDTHRAIHEAIERSVVIAEEGKQSEAAFTQETLIPILKRLGFRDVVFRHGPREFGRDVLFCRPTEFGVPEYWAAQVKLGNVSGKSNSYIDHIVSQAQESFKIPLQDLQTKSKLWISKFVVAISGRFTENAIEKICEKIESHSQRNNIIFLDGEKIRELSRKAGLRKKGELHALSTRSV